MALTIHVRLATAGMAALLLLAVAPGPASAAMPAPPNRPDGCAADACDACTPYSVAKADLVTPLDQALPCGSDGAYFPVPTKFEFDCEDAKPTAWKCLPCCSAGCAVGACQFAWSGSYNGTHGCAKCPPKLKTQDLTLSRQSCRACNGTDIGCDGDGASAYTVCGKQAPTVPRDTQSAGSPSPAPEDAAPSPPAKAASPPPASPPPPEEESPSPSPSPELASPPAELPPAPAPAPEEALIAPAPGPVAFAPAPVPEPAAAPPPAPAPVSTPAPAPASAGVAAGPCAALLLALLAAALLG
ncbi:hypothetical protein ABPG75_006680 [Micractinium tetrahymenae]